MGVNTIIDRDTVTDIIDQSDVELREDYPFSAFDPPCLAIVGTDRQLLQFYIDLARVEYDLATDLADRMRWDNLGYEIVHYFSGYELSPPDADLAEVEEV